MIWRGRPQRFTDSRSGAHGLRSGADDRRPGSSPVAGSAVTDGSGAGDPSSLPAPLSPLTFEGGLLVHPHRVRAVTSRGSDLTRIYLRGSRRSHLTVAEPMTAVVARLAAVT